MDSEGILFSSSYYYSSILIENQHVDIVQELCEKCSDYYELVEGKNVTPTAGKELFTDLPPDRGYEDKVVIGIFDTRDNLIGVIDMIKNYPKSGIWFIGLFMIDPKERNRKLGESIIQSFSSWAYDSGARELRLGVLEENQRAYKFWSRMGFELDTKKPYKTGNKETTVYVMEKKLLP